MTEQLVERPAASIDVDAQHGPLVSVTINGHTVSVYLMGESAVYTDRDTRQAGMEVTGPWFKFREAITLLSPVEDGEAENQARFCRQVGAYRAADLIERQQQEIENAVDAKNALRQRVRELKQEIEALRNPWVSVEEAKKPSPLYGNTGAGDNYLLAFGGEDSGEENYVTGFYMHGYWYSAGAEEHLPEPIAVMPLPPPPEQDKP